MPGNPCFGFVLSVKGKLGTVQRLNSYPAPKSKFPTNPGSFSMTHALGKNSTQRICDYFRFSSY